jgi:hypothetical protein
MEFHTGENNYLLAEVLAASIVHSEEPRPLPGLKRTPLPISPTLQRFYPMVNG